MKASFAVDGTWRVQDNLEYILGEIAEPELDLEDEFTVEIDTLSGDSRITHIVREDESTDETEEGFQLDEFISVGPTLEVNSVDVEGPDHIDEDLLDFLRDRYGFRLADNPCGPSALEVTEQCVIDGFCDNVTGSQQSVWAEAVDDAPDDHDGAGFGIDYCESIAEIGDEALLDAGLGAGLGPAAIYAYWLTVCDFSLPSLGVSPILDDVGFVTVTCFEPGKFNLSIVDKASPSPPEALQDFEIDSQAGDSVGMSITCRDTVAAASMVAKPTPIEIIPQLGSVAHSLVGLTLKDSTGGPAVPGSDVLFTTSRCAIESSAVDDEDSFESAEAVFAAYEKFDFTTAADIEGHAAATTSPDGDPTSENVQTFSVFSSSGAERVVAVTVLHCDTSDAPGAGPGPAKITAVVERPGEDLVLSGTVDVVGPPVPGGLSVTANPTTIVCGEKSQLSVTVLDAIGQPVSDHTPAEAITNYGGVLGGTGAVAEDLLPVTPLASTEADTFGGLAIFYLITSDEHVGPYEVLVTTGGLVSGATSGAPFSAQVAVECVPGEPSVTAPATGTGSITPEHR